MRDIEQFFKAYDIRGSVEAGLDGQFAYGLGLALGQKFRPKNCILGHDARLSSPDLAVSLARGLANCGHDITCAGLCGTEEIYYAAAFEGFDLGVMVTGSHNPIGENGFKVVGPGAVPIDASNGLMDICHNMQLNCHLESNNPGRLRKRNYRDNYVDWLLRYTGYGSDKKPGQVARPLRIVVDAGNGCAGPMLDALRPFLPVEFIGLDLEPDGNFPNGIPNPLLPEMRHKTSAAVRASDADLGIAFDGDFDRCFFFDNEGNLVESCYLVGLLATELLALYPGQKIVHDPRVYWCTRELVIRAGGECIMGKGGHSNMKAAMRAADALYGGEMSAHHFYRDFAYCDSGMLTMLLVIGVLLRTGKSIGELTEASRTNWPCSGEKNFRLKDAQSILDRIWDKYAPQAVHADRLDGINLEFENWRFNLRSSNTEPLVRLNIEARQSRQVLQERLEELEAILGGC